MKITNLIILTLLVLSTSVTGWAQQPELSGFLDDYPPLTPAGDGSGVLIWKAPNIEAKYVAVFVDQPQIFIHPDSPYKGIEPDELKVLSDAYREIIATKLATVHPVVEQPGPNTIRLRLALTNVYVRREGGSSSGASNEHTLKRDLGRKYSLVEATVEAEGIDNETGQRLAVAVRKKVRQPGDDLNDEATSWDDLRAALDELTIMGIDEFASFWVDSGITRRANPTVSAEQAQLNLRAVIRQLNMVGYITAFDYLTASVQGNKVTLGGFTIGLGVLREAEGRVKTLEWVEEVVNDIEQLPLSGGDRNIRAGVYSRLVQYVPRTFSGNRALIRIGVKRGEVTLVGLVESELMKGVAVVQAQSVPLVKSVDDQLVVMEKSS
ncbi:MAG: DUF3313 family protein [Acidobacteria bacterium]|nr:MAG: DUF3313 family protein [Acidobacteriota bacterium]